MQVLLDNEKLTIGQQILVIIWFAVFQQLDEICFVCVFVSLLALERLGNDKVHNLIPTWNIEPEIIVNTFKKGKVDAF